MSQSPESKDELMPLRRSTRKSVVSKVEEQALTPKKRKSTSTPLKNVLDKGADNAGTPRKTRGTATPRKSVADQISLTPRKSVSNARSDESPKKKDISTPRKTLSAHIIPANDSKETNKRTPRKSTVTETSPVNTQKETNKRTPRKSIRSTKEIKKPDEANEDEQKPLSEEVTSSSRGKRKSVVASLLKRTSPSHSIKDSDSGIVSFDEDSQSTLEEQKLSPKKKSRKSVHFKKEVDEHHLELESERPNSPSPTKTVSGSLVSDKILKSSLALVPKVMLTDVKPVVREAESAESAIIDASYIDMKENSSKCETKVPSEDTLDKVLLSPAKFLTSDEDGADKEADENLKINISNGKLSCASSLLQELPDSEKIDKHKSPRRKLAYESQNINETVTILNLEKKSIDFEAKVQNDSEAKETESIQTVNEAFQSNSPRKSNSLSPDVKSSPGLNEHNTPSNSPQCKVINSPESCIVTNSENDLNINRTTGSSKEIVNSELADTSCSVSESPVSSSEKTELSEERKNFRGGEYQANNSYSVSSTGEIYEPELSLPGKGESCTDDNSKLRNTSSNINTTEKVAASVSYPRTTENASSSLEISVSLDKSTVPIEDVIDSPNLGNILIATGTLNKTNPDNQKDQAEPVNKNAISSMVEERGNFESQSETVVHDTSVSVTKANGEVPQSDFETMNSSFHSVSAQELDNSISSRHSVTNIDLKLSIKGKDSDEFSTEVSNSSFIQVDSAPDLEEETSRDQEGCNLKEDSLRVTAHKDVEISGDSNENRKSEVNSLHDLSKLKDDLNSTKSGNELEPKLETEDTSELRGGNQIENTYIEERAGSSTSQSVNGETLNESEEKHSSENDSSTKICESENKTVESEFLPNSKIQCELDSSKLNENKSLVSPELDNADSVPKSDTRIKELHEEEEAVNVKNICESPELHKIKEKPAIPSTELQKESPLIKAPDNNLADESECFELKLPDATDSEVQLPTHIGDVEVNEKAFSSKLPFEHDSSKPNEFLSECMEGKTLQPGFPIDPKKKIETDLNSSSNRYEKDTDFLPSKDIKSSSNSIDMSTYTKEHNSKDEKVYETSPKSLPHCVEKRDSIGSPKKLSNIEGANNESGSETVNLTLAHEEGKKYEKVDKTPPISEPPQAEEHNSAYFVVSPYKRSNIEVVINDSTMAAGLNSTLTEEDLCDEKVNRSSKSVSPQGVEHNFTFSIESPNKLSNIEVSINDSSVATDLNSTHTEKKNSNEKFEEASPKSLSPHNGTNSTSVRSPIKLSKVEKANESSSGIVDLNSSQEEEISSKDKKVHETSHKSLSLHDNEYNSTSVESPNILSNLEDVISDSSDTVNLNSTHAKEKNENGKLKVDETSPKSLHASDEEHCSSSINSPKILSGTEDVIKDSPSVTSVQPISNADHTQKLIDLDGNDDVSISVPTNGLFEKKEIIPHSILLRKRSKKQQYLCTKKPYLESNSASTELEEDVLSDKNLSSRSETNVSPSPLGKRSQTDIDTLIKKSKVAHEFKKNSIPLKKKELEQPENRILVSDFVDLEAEEGEESEITNASSSVEEAEESSNSSCFVESAFDFLDKEAKEYKKTCHVGTVDTLFNKTLSEDEDDTDWLPPKNLADNLASISMSQKLKANLNRKLKVVKNIRPLKKKSSTKLITKAGIFSNSAESLTSNAKDTYVPKGFKVSSEKKPLAAENYVPKGFIITETEKTSGKSIKYSTTMLPVLTNSLKNNNSKANGIEKNNVDFNIQKSFKSENGNEIKKWSGMAVFPFRLNKSDVKKAFGDVGINDVLSVEYRSTTTALLEFGSRKSLKKAINLYGQIMHSGKPIYVLETKDLP